jgi:two-component system LytT family sensor kinase
MKQMHSLISRITHYRFGSHFMFWLFIFTVFLIGKTSSEAAQTNFTNLILVTVLCLIVPLIASYLLCYYLIPRLFGRKKYFSFFILFTSSAYLLCVLGRIIIVHAVEPLIRVGDFDQESIREIFVQLGPLMGSFFPKIYFIAFAMAFLKQQKAQHEIKQRNVLLEKEKAETELNFLKAQLHPHFLFNTLNNLYALTLKKSDKAPEAVIKLSEILDYVLYRGNDEVVSVEKEIKLLNNYIALEELRYGEHLKVSFIKDVDNESIGISPLLLLSIVENAFKHGASGTVEDPEIKVALNIKDQVLSFKVYNTKSPFATTDGTGYRKGIGLSNTRRQLALTYSDYCFDVREGERDYLVRLTINLKSTIQSSAKRSVAKADVKISSSLTDLQDERMLAQY